MRRLAATDPFAGSSQCNHCRVPWTPLERHLDICLWQDADTVIQRRAELVDESNVTKSSE